MTSLDDVAAISSLQASSFAQAWGEDAIRWELEHSHVARVYAARDQSAAIVAYCAAWLLVDELHINSLAVAKSCRRRGAARRLLTHVFEDAIASGARKATLEVRRSNQAAQALYEGLGFSVEAVRRDYYQHPREDALILWHRDLPSARGLPCRA